MVISGSNCKAMNISCNLYKKGLVLYLTFDQFEELSLKTTNFKGQIDRNAWTLNEIMERFPALEELIYSL